MAKKKVSLQTFAQIVQNMPAKLDAGGVLAARKSAARLVVFVEDSIRNNLPHALVDRGRLLQSVTVINTPTGAIVRVDAPYAAPLEFGARPFMPPLEPILEWARRKGFQDPGAVAHAVRWHFYHYGMKPTHFFLRAVQAWKKTNDLPIQIQRRLAQLPPGATTPAT